MQLEAGMRVRCVRAGFGIRVGDECILARVSGPMTMVMIHGLEGWMNGSRFKPIVRVKAQCVPSLSLLINRAVAEFAKLSPIEKTAIYKAQAESWARSCVGFD